MNLQLPRSVPGAGAGPVGRAPRAAGRRRALHGSSTGHRRAGIRGAPAYLSSRREHDGPTTKTRRHHGSPQLARRARGPGRRGVGFRWFTSARAESTRQRQMARAAGAVHPESTMASMSRGVRPAVHLGSRGEHNFCRYASRGTCGTPPLARRARQGPGRGRIRRRFTSARAESMTSTPCPWARRPVHLRSCGEHSVPASDRNTVDGSLMFCGFLSVVVRRCDASG